MTQPGSVTAGGRFTLDTARYEATGESEVLAGDRRIGSVLGCKIEAQFEVALGDGMATVLLVSADSIFVGLLHILLVRDGAIVERRQLGDGSAQGLATEIRQDGPTTITFRFPFDEPNRLHVEKRSSLFGLRQRFLHLD